MTHKLPKQPSSYPEHASEKTQIVFELLDIYRVENNISPDAVLSASQIAEVCQMVSYEACKIEGIFMTRSK